MASGWDQAQKKVIRNNGRNTGPVIWNEDALAAQVVDAVGHDTNDETLADSITETLNLRGWNAMLGDLDVGTFKMVNVLDGTAGTDGINKGQLDSGLSGKVGEAPIDGTKYARQNAAWTPADGGTNPDDIIISQNWDGMNFTSVRASGDFVTDFTNFASIVVVSYKSNGPVRQVLNDQGIDSPVEIDVSTHNRHRMNNEGAVTMNFSGLPTLDDPDLGDTYTVEGAVRILNGAAPGTITLADIGTPTIIGAQNTTANAGQVLTYLIDRVSGVNHTTLVWSAE
jgi:hypothetical protein